MTRLQLREYQSTALDRTDEALGRGVRSQLGVAATGLGKTVIFVSLAERMQVPTLVLAHRDELIVQAAAKVLEVWPELGATKEAHVLLRANGHGALMADVALRSDGLGIVKAGANDVGARVVIASVQTLARQSRLDKLPTERFGLVVVDEAHHAAADSYRRVLDHVRAGQPAGCECGHTREQHTTIDYGLSTRGVACCVEHEGEPGACACSSPTWLDDGPLLLGVTATPDRGDGRGLDDLFGEIVWNFDILWGIRSGFLCDLRGLAVRLDVDMSGLKVQRGDFDQGQAGRMLTDADAPRLIVDAWLAHAKGRRTLVFTPTVATAHEVADEFTHRGVRAAMVHGGTPLDERRRLLRAFEAGEIDVMANCAVLTEGYDNPRVDCIVVARPTKSRALYTQMVGRGTRRHPEKDDTLILDVVGAATQHNLVTIPSLFGLPEPAVWEGGSELLTGAIDRHEQAEIAAGRLRAEEIELFHKLRATIAWAEAEDRSTGRKRYVMGLGKGKPTVVLASRQLPDGDVEWIAGLQADDGTKSVLIDHVPLETAQGVAEDFIRASGVSAQLIDPAAKWRSKRPSPEQLKAAGKWRLKVDPSWTRGELSAALDAHIATIKGRNR